MPKMHDSMDTTVDELPNEILVKIIYELDLRSKLRAQLVCKRWRDVIDGMFAMITSLVVEDYGHNRYNKRYGDYRPYKLDTNAGHVFVICLNQVVLKTITKHQDFQRLLSQMSPKFPNIKVLSICLTDCHLNDNVLHLVVNSFGDRDLQQLSIICGKSTITITETEALALAINYPNLNVFQFESLYVLIREKTIEVLLKNLPKLDVFILTSILSNSEEMDEELYSGQAFQWINSGIKVIKIPAYLFTDTAIQCLRHKMVNQLRDLRLIVRLVDPKSMALIADSFPRLQRLDCLSFQSDFTQTQVNGFFADISRLDAMETLNLSLESDKSTISYTHMKALKKCTKLRSLSIEWTAMAADCVEGMARFVPQLQKLKLTNNRLPSDPNQCLSPIGHMKHLTHLKLSTYPEIKDQLVIHVINECPQLKHLDLSYCTDITIESIIELIEVAKQTPIKYIKCLINSGIKEDYKQLALNLPQNLKLIFCLNCD